MENVCRWPPRRWVHVRFTLRILRTILKLDLSYVFTHTHTHARTRTEGEREVSRSAYPHYTLCRHRRECISVFALDTDTYRHTHTPLARSLTLSHAGCVWRWRIHHLHCFVSQEQEFRPGVGICMGRTVWPLCHTGISCPSEDFQEL